MNSLRPGFSREAESTAEQVRADLRIGNLKRLDPLALAAELEIPVRSLTQIGQLASSPSGLDDALEVLLGAEQSALSAVTVFRGTERLIVFNDCHTVERQASDLTHELAHSLLLHPPAVALDHRGCRAWDTTIENEATYLGGALLVPGKAARWIAKSGLAIEVAAQRFGCSEQMINWRINASGGRRWAKATGTV